MSNSMTVRDALGQAMAEEMRRDKDVFVMGEEVAEYNGAYKITKGLLDEFGPDRVIDTPITEHGFAGIAVGAAFTGLKPVIEFMTFNFAMQAMDHIINSAAKTNYMSGGQVGCPIVFRGPNGAASRVGAQHSQCFASWYAHVPGLKVVSPYSAMDHKILLKAAIRDPNPVIFLENEMLYGESHEFCDSIKDEDIDFASELSKINIIKEGSDVTITSFSLQMQNVLAAAEILQKDYQINAEIIDTRILRPFNKDIILDSVKKTNRIVCVEEGWGFAGICSEISSVVTEEAFDYLDAPPKRVYGLDVPMPYAKNLEDLSLPSVDDIVSAAKEVCYK